MIVAVDFDGTLQVKDEHGKLVSEHHADGTAGNRAAPRRHNNPMVLQRRQKACRCGDLLPQVRVLPELRELQRADRGEDDGT